MHQLTFAVKEEGPSVLTLGGRSWQTKYIDWPRKKAYVEPTEMRGRSQWLSAGQPMHYEMCQSMASVLRSESMYEGLSARAIGLLEQIRAEFDWIAPNATTLIIDADRNVIWWTFAGKLFNAVIASALTEMADKISTDNLGISFSHVYNIEELLLKIKSIMAKEHTDLIAPLDEDFIKELKFSECLSQESIDAELIARYSFEKEYKAVAAMDLAVLHQHS